MILNTLIALFLFLYISGTITLAFYLKDYSKYFEKILQGTFLSLIFAVILITIKISKIWNF